MLISPHLYKVLELANFASREEINKSYRRLVLIHHPDRGGDTRKMQDINIAYEFLSKHKAEYDRRLKGLNRPPQIIITYQWSAGSDTSTSTNSFY